MGGGELLKKVEEYGNPGWASSTDSCSEDLSGSSCTYIGSLKFENFTLPTHYPDITTQYAKQTYSNFVLRYYEGSAWKYVYIQDADTYISVDASSSGTHFKIFAYVFGTYSMVLCYDAGDEGFRVGSDTHLIQSFEIYGIYGNSDAWAEFSQVLQSVGGSSDKLEETDSTYTELKKDELLRNPKIPMPDLIEHPKPPKTPPTASQSGSQSGG